MSQLRSLLFVAALVGTLQAGRAQDLKSGTHEKQFEHGDLSRTYRIRIPPAYDGSKAVPLVLAFHGGGQRGLAITAERGFGFNPLADKHGFIAVYPEGVEHHWNDGRESPRFPNATKIDDVGFIRDLIDHLERTYKIDPDRIYATGASNGGFISHRLGWELSEKLAAIAPVAGTFGKAMASKFAPQHPLHVLHIHGTKDAAVPFDGGTVIGQGGLVISVAETVGLWVQVNGCIEKPVVDYLPKKDDGDPTKVRRESFAAGDKGAEVVLLAIEGHGHNWPGRPAIGNLAGPGTKQLNAEEVIWDFFRAHPKLRR